MYARGLAIGAEARGKGVNIQLGPVVGPLGRKPRGGRIWEGFGADPVIQAVGGAETIKGIFTEPVKSGAKTSPRHAIQWCYCNSEALYWK